MLIQFMGVCRKQPLDWRIYTSKNRMNTFRFAILYNRLKLKRMSGPHFKYSITATEKSWTIREKEIVKNT